MYCFTILFDSYEKEVIKYDVSDLDYLASIIDLDQIEISKKKKEKVVIEYWNIPISFDIETTSIYDDKADRYIGFMYQWQFGLGRYVIMGRRWDEFQVLHEWLKDFFGLCYERRLAIYVHALMFEFQFMRNFIDITDMFARKRRVPLRFLADGCFEYRCSYALSNMSLAKFIKNTPNAMFYKRDGDEFDYSVLRTPDTELTDKELGYCYCDVAGLNEAIGHYMDEYDIANMPMTSTGFLRNEVRKAVNRNKANRKQLQNLRLNDVQYVLCKAAARGGNAHANAYYSNEVIADMASKDIKSSYPAVMICGLFPVTPFRLANPCESTVQSYLGDKAMLMDITIYNVSIKDPCTIPYISLAKCTAASGIRKDNGRIITADMLSMVITDIDYRIIFETYNFDGFEARSIYIANYGKLNIEFRTSLMEMFKEKCRLEIIKDMTGDAYWYNKFKNKINAYFGMMLTDICSPEVLYTGNPESPWREGDIDIIAMLDKYYKNPNSFLTYQHGLWVTAQARNRLQEAINRVGHDSVYVDTDSLKYFGNHEYDFDQLNRQWDEVCDNNDISPRVTIDGKTTTLGVWDDDGHYSEFKTLGAKKYIYKKEGKDNYEITVAGLSKDKGASYINRHGGIDLFAIGETIPAKDENGKMASGRTASYFNDVEAPYMMTVNGCTFMTGSNIGVKEVSYTFGVSDDYWEYLLNVDSSNEFLRSSAVELNEEEEKEILRNEELFEDQ